MLEYGQGADPASWTILTESTNPVKDATLYLWDLTTVPNGIITLRLTLVGDNAEVEKLVTINLSLPTPTLPPATPTETPSPTLIPPPTETPTIEIIIPTETPTETPTLPSP